MEEQILLLQQKRDISPWQKTDLLIEQWLMQRQTLLVLYNQICPSKASEPNPFRSKALQTFCQILMDYLSAGHFKIFEKLAEAYHQSESASDYQKINNMLLEKILYTTQIALDFNDKYTDSSNLKELSDDLSSLGENLAHRMEWEDKLIKTYLSVTRH